MGLYSLVGGSITHEDKARAIDFAVAVEEKNRLALRPPEERFTREDTGELMAELDAFGRSADRHSTVAKPARARALVLSGRSLVG